MDGEGGREGGGELGESAVAHRVIRRGAFVAVGSPPSTISSAPLSDPANGSRFSLRLNIQAAVSEHERASCCSSCLPCPGLYLGTHDLVGPCERVKAAVTDTPVAQTQATRILDPNRKAPRKVDLSSKAPPTSKN